jgi:predicted ATP-grasp superfamily ATP-dependent carboligase
LPNLAGYVGFDVVVPFDSPRQPLIVEINPRLTTSYLGYRALADDNLAERLLASAPSHIPICWKSGSVAFLPDGSIELMPEQDVGRSGLTIDHGGEAR